MKLNLLKKALCLILPAFPITQNMHAQNKKLDSLQKTLQLQKEDTGKVNTLNELAYSYRNIDPDTGLYYGKKALALSENLKWETGIAKSYKCIGNNYFSLSDATEALTYFEKAAKIYGQLDNKIGIAESLSNISTVYESLSDHVKALEYAQKGLDMFEQLKYKPGIAVNLSNLGAIYWALADYPKTLENYLKTLRICEELGDKEKMAKVLGNLGVLYTDLADYPKALEYCKRSLKMHEALGNKLSMGIVTSAVGTVYYNSSDYPKALEYYTQSLKIAREVGDQSGIAEGLSGIGSVYLNLSDFQNAIKYCRESYTMYVELGNKSAVANSLYNIGDIYFKADNASLLKMGIAPVERLSKAKEKLISSLQIAVEIGALDLQANALEALSIIYEKENNIVKAYATYKKYISVRDSVLNDTKKKELAQKQFQFEFDKKEDQIKLLSTENKLKSAVAAQENQKKNFAYMGIGVLLLTGGYGFYRYRLRKKLETLQSLMKERLRLSRELHDEVGSTLSGIAMYSHLAKEQIKNTDTLEVERSLNIMQQSAGEMVNKLNDIVWLVNPRQDSLQKLIQRLEEYATDMAMIKNMQVKVRMQEHLYEHNLSMESRRNIYLFCKEAINNAVKYSNGSLLELNVKETDSKLEFSVSDNGKGFDAVTVRRGNGLENMQKRADEIGAKLTVQSKEGEGTLVSMQIIGA